MDTLRTAISVLRGIQTGRAIYREASELFGWDDRAPATHRSPGPSAATAACLVGGGVLVGVGIGLLVAPTSGRQLRERIAAGVRELRGERPGGDAGAGGLHSASAA